MTAPPPASPPPKMSQTTNQELPPQVEMGIRALLSLSKLSPMRPGELEKFLRATASDAYAEGRAEGAAEQRKRDADVAARIERYDVRTALYKHKQSIAAAIEKEPT